MPRIRLMRRIALRIPHACMKRQSLHHHAHVQECCRRFRLASRDRGLCRVVDPLRGASGSAPGLPGWNEMLRLLEYPEATSI